MTTENSVSMDDWAAAMSEQAAAPIPQPATGLFQPLTADPAPEVSTDGGPAISI